jgi:hypothetical protein
VNSGRRSGGTGSRWRWSVLRHRPRLLRLDRVERRDPTDHFPEESRTTLIDVGERGKTTPFFVVGVTCGERTHAFELTFYPARPEGRARHAPRPLLTLFPTTTVGRVRAWLMVTVWPGYQHQFVIGWSRRPRGW